MGGGDYFAHRAGRESAPAGRPDYRETDGFIRMDFATRDLYRSVIEHLARVSHLSELDIAQKALSATQQIDTAIEVDQQSDTGYHLLGRGRPALEQAIGFHMPARLRFGRLAGSIGIGGYILSIAIITFALLGLTGWSLSNLELPLVLL